MLGREGSRIIVAPISPIIMDGDCGLPLTIGGMMDESTTRRASSPRTRSRQSTTAEASVPILQVPTGWYVVIAVCRT